MTTTTPTQRTTKAPGDEKLPPSVFLAVSIINGIFLGIVLTLNIRGLTHDNSNPDTEALKYTDSWTYLFCTAFLGILNISQVAHICIYFEEEQEIYDAQQVRGRLLKVDLEQGNATDQVHVYDKKRTGHKRLSPEPSFTFGTAAAFLFWVLDANSGLTREYVGSKAAFHWMFVVFWGCFCLHYFVYLLAGACVERMNRGGEGGSKGLATASNEGGEYGGEHSYVPLNTIRIEEEAIAGVPDAGREAGKCCQSCGQQVKGASV